MPDDRKRSTQKKKPQEALFQERFFIDVAIAFANHMNLESCDSPTYAENVNGIWWNHMGFDYAEVGPRPTDPKSIFEAQTRVNNQLEDMARHLPLTPEREKQINRLWLSKCRAFPQLQDGQSKFLYKASDTAEAAVLGVGLLFVTGLAGRIHQCARKKCFNFLLADGNRSRMKYCSIRCSKFAEQEHSKRRQQKYREKRRD